MKNGREIQVWDPLVRVFHWSLALTFLANYWITEDGGNWHVWIGYAAAALVAIRVVWGFIGPVNARFARFVPTPERVSRHWHELRRGQGDPLGGHNPLGGAMVILLMALILGLGTTGFMMEEVDRFWGEEWVEELHELLANLTMAAVVVHVTAVFVMQRWTGVELLRPMITGRRRVSKRNSVDAHRSH